MLNDGYISIGFSYEDELEKLKTALDDLDQQYIAKERSIKVTFDESAFKQSLTNIKTQLANIEPITIKANVDTSGVLKSGGSGSTGSTKSAKETATAYTQLLSVIKQLEKAETQLNNTQTKNIKNGGLLSNEVETQQKAVQKLKEQYNELHAGLTALANSGDISWDDINTAQTQYEAALDGSATSAQNLKIAQDKLNESVRQYQELASGYSTKLAAFTQSSDYQDSAAYQQAVDQLKQYVEEYNKLTTLISQNGKNGLQFITTEQKNNLKEVETNIKSIIKEIESGKLNSSTGNGLLINTADISAAENYLRSMDNILQSSVKINSQTKELSGTIKNVDGSMQNVKLTFDESTQSYRVLLGNVEESVGLFSQLSAQIKSSFQYLSKYLSGYMFATTLINGVREGIEAITELDTALTEMRKVSDDSKQSLEELQQSFFDLADTIGTTAADLSEATASFMRIGESAEEAAESAKQAAILYNVSEFESIEDAADSLVAISQAYDEIAKADIVDIINELGNNYAIATDELSESLQTVSATMSLLGVSLEETSALVTTANQTIQDESKVANGLRTIALRIFSTEEGNEELEAMGEEVDEFVTTTVSAKDEIIKSYTAVASNAHKGVSIIDEETGAYRNLYDILLDIAEIYEEIQAEDLMYGTNRATALIEELAGKNRSNILSALLSDPDTLKASLTSALEAEGSAEEELEKYLDSIEGKLSQLENKVQEFWSNIISSDTIKWVLDVANSAMDAIDALTQMNGIVPTVAAALSAFKGSTVFDGLIKKAGLFDTELGKIIESSEAARIALSSIATWAVTTALQELLVVLNEVRTAEEDLCDSVSSMTTDMNSATESIEDYKSQIQAQVDILNDESSTVQESADARAELIAIQEELITSFGNESDVIDIVTDAINNSVDALDELAAKEYEVLKEDYLVSSLGQSIKNAVGGYSDNLDRITSTMENGVTELGYTVVFSVDDEELDKELSELDGLIRNEDWYGVEYTLADGTLEEQKETLEAMGEIVDRRGMSGLFDNASGALSAAQDFYDSYADFYELYLMYDSDSPLQGYTDEYANLQAAYESYQDAVIAGDTEAKNSALSLFQTLWDGLPEDMDGSVTDFLENTYSTMLAEVSTWQFEVDFAANTDLMTDQLKSLIGTLVTKDTLSDFLEGDFEADTQAAKVQEELLKLRDAYNLTNDQLVNMLSECGILISDVEYELRQAFSSEQVESLGDDLQYAIQIDGATLMSWEELLQAIERVKAEAKSVEISDVLKTAADELAESYELSEDTLESLSGVVDIDGLNGSVEVTKALIDAQNEAIASRQELYDVLAQDASSDNFETAIEAMSELNDLELDDLVTSVELLADLSSQLTDVSEMIGDSLTVAAEDVSTLANIYPELLVGAEVFTDGSIQLDQERVASALGASQDIVEADTEQYETMINNKLALIDAEISYHEANLETLQAALDGEITFAEAEQQLTENTKEYQAQCAETLAQAEIEYTGEAATANADASQNVMDNSEITTEVVLENLGLIAQAIAEVSSKYAAMLSGEVVDGNLSVGSAVSGTASNYTTYASAANVNAGTYANESEFNTIIDNIKAQIEYETSELQGLYNERAAYTEALSDLMSMDEIEVDSSGSGSSGSDAAEDEANSIVDAYEEAKEKLEMLRDRDKISERQYLSYLNALYEEFYGDCEDYLEEYAEEEREFLEDLKDWYEGVFDYIISLYEDRMDALEDECEAVIEALEAEKEAALAAYDAQIEAIEAEIDALEELIEEYEAMIEALEEQIEMLEDQIDALEDQKEEIQDQIDAIQDEIDAIEEANEERQRALDLETALYELERAKNQRTKLVYSAESGYTYEVDESAVADAEEDVAQAELEIQIAALEEEIAALEEIQDLIDEQIEAIEEQIEALEDEIDAIEDLIDEVEDQIDALEDEIDAIEELKDATEEYYDTLIEQTEEYYQSQIDALQEMADAFEELMEMYETAQMQQALLELGYTEEEVLALTAEGFERLQTQYLAVLAALSSGNEELQQQLADLAGMDLETLLSYVDLASDSFYELAETDITGLTGDVDTLTTSTGDSSTSVSELDTSLSSVSSTSSSTSGTLETIADAVQLIADNSSASIDILSQLASGLSAAGSDEVVTGLSSTNEQLGNISSHDYATVVDALDLVVQKTGEVGSAASSAEGYMATFCSAVSTTSTTMTDTTLPFDEYIENYAETETNASEATDTVSAFSDVVADTISEEATENLSSIAESFDSISTADFTTVSDSITTMKDSLTEVRDTAEEVVSTIGGLGDGDDENGTSLVSAFSSAAEASTTHTETMATNLNNVADAATSAVEAIGGALGGETSSGESGDESGESAEEGSATSIVGALSAAATASTTHSQTMVENFGEVTDAAMEVVSAISGESGGDEEGEEGEESGSSGDEEGSSEGDADNIVGALELAADTSDETKEDMVEDFGETTDAIYNTVAAITGEYNGSDEGAENAVDPKSSSGGSTYLIGALKEDLVTASQEANDSVQADFDASTESIKDALEELQALVEQLNAMGAEIVSITVEVSTEGLEGEFEGTVGNAFAKGTVGHAYSTGKYPGLDEDTLAVRSEYGQPELTIYPNGEAELTTEPTMSKLPKDTVIFNEEQTNRIIGNKGTMLKSLAGGTIQELEADHFLRTLMTQTVQAVTTAYYDATTGLVVKEMSNLINEMKGNNANRQIMQTFNVTLPNVNDSTAAQSLLRDLQNIGARKYQYFG